MTQGACDTCNGTGVCLMCDGKGTIVPEHDIEVFSYILDKKGAYRDVKPPPKTCPGCGGWGGVPLFRGINPGVSPSPVMQTGPRKRIGENGEGNGACRKCEGRGAEALLRRRGRYRACAVRLLRCASGVLSLLRSLKRPCAFGMTA